MAQPRAPRDPTSQMLAILNESQTQKSAPCVKRFMKLYTKMYSDERYERFLESFAQGIKFLLKCESGSNFTQKGIHFLADLFAEISKFDIEKENERLEQLAAEDNQRGVVESSSDSSELDELGALALEDSSDNTIIDQRFQARPTSIDKLFKNELVHCLKVDSSTIRQNTTLLLKESLERMDEIDEQTFNKIAEALIERTFDAVKPVRDLAISSLIKLQNHPEVAENVFVTLKFHNRHNPDPKSRVIALNVMKITQDSLECLTGSTRDVSPTVRRKAYFKIGETTQIFNFDSETRLILLKNAIYERDPSVKKMVLKKMLTPWLAYFEYDLVQFVSYISIRENEEFCSLLLHDLLQELTKSCHKQGHTKFNEALFYFKKHYLDDIKLNAEAYFIWHQLCAFCFENQDLTYQDFENVSYGPNDSNKALPSSLIMPEFTNQDGSNWSLNDSGESLPNLKCLDLILPKITEYCEHVDELLKSKQSPVKAKELRKYCFVQLIQICKGYNRDDGDWDKLIGTFISLVKREDFFDLMQDCIVYIMEIFAKNCSDNEELLKMVLDLINDINLPESHEQEEGEDGINVKVTCEKDKDEAIRLLDKAIEQLRCRRLSADAKGDEDEGLALSSRIKKLIIKRNRLIEGSETCINTPDPERQCPRIEKDPLVFGHCLQICHSFSATLTKEHFPRLSILINQIVLKTTDPQLIHLAVQTLTLYCLKDLDECNYYLKMFVEMATSCASIEIRCSVLKFLFDATFLHGFSGLRFVVQKKSKESDFAQLMSLLSSEGPQDSNDTFKNVFIRLICSCLSDFKESTPGTDEFVMFEIAVQGICKLLTIRPKSLDRGLFFSKLLIFLHTSTTAESLKQFIHGFFLEFTTLLELTRTNNLISNYNSVDIANSFITALRFSLINIKCMYNEEEKAEDMISHARQVMHTIYLMTRLEDLPPVIQGSIQLLTRDMYEFWGEILRFISDCASAAPFLLDGEQLQLYIEQLQEFITENIPTGPHERGTYMFKVDVLATKIVRTFESRLPGLPIPPIVLPS